MKFAKTTRWYTGLLLLIAIFGMTPLCSAATASDKTSIEDVKKETKDLIQALKGYSVAQRDEATAKIKATLGHLDQRINALELTIGKNWDKMDAAGRETASASLAELRKERTEVAELYGGLKSSSADAWEDMKKVFSEAYVGLSTEWEKVEKEYSAEK